MIIQEKQHLIWKEKDIKACLNKDKEKELENGKFIERIRVLGKQCMMVYGKIIILK